MRVSLLRPPGADHVTGGFAIAGLLVAVCLGAAGCELFAGDEQCGSPCRATFTCDSSAGVCRPKSLSSFGGNPESPPARHLAAAPDGDAVLLAALAPEHDLVVAGRPGSDWSVLDRLEDTADRSVAVDTTPERASVAWLGDDARFRLATRREGRWRVASVDTDSSYQGTRHLDVVDGNQGRRILFRDREQERLLALRERPDAPWELELVDDGTAVPERSDCSAGGGDPARSGVGLDPDAERIDATLFVSYYDAECGDLRLGRRVDGSWRADVLATGDFVLPGASDTQQAGDVGRFSSLAADSQGRLAVAYQDVRRGRLMFARQTSDGFDTQLVDPGIRLDEFSQERKQLVGAFADLTFRREGSEEIPYIAYMNGSGARLRLANRASDSSDANWLHRTLDPPSPAGFYAAIAFSEGSEIAIFAERLTRGDGGFASRLVEVRREVPR